MPTLDYDTDKWDDEKSSDTTDERRPEIQDEGQKPGLQIVSMSDKGKSEERIRKRQGIIGEA